MQVISYGSDTNVWASDINVWFPWKQKGRIYNFAFQPSTKLPPSGPAHSLYIFEIFLEAQPAKP